MAGRLDGLIAVFPRGCMTGGGGAWFVERYSQIDQGVARGRPSKIWGRAVEAEAGFVAVVDDKIVEASTMLRARPRMTTRRMSCC